MPARVPGVATADPADGQDSTARGAVRTQGIGRVLGAAGHEPAPRPEPRAHEVAVGRNQEEADAHQRTTSSNRRATDAAARRGPEWLPCCGSSTGRFRSRTTTCSPSISASLSANAPRTLRLKALRSTDRRNALRPTTSPSSGVPAGSTLSAWIVASVVDQRRPFTITSRKARSPRRRWRLASIGNQDDRLKAGHGPSAPWPPPCRDRTQTARRARPLRRRAFRTARPALVAMRARKPWVRLRRTTEGW